MLSLQDMFGSLCCLCFCCFMCCFLRWTDGGMSLMHATDKGHDTVSKTIKTSTMITCVQDAKINSARSWKTLLFSAGGCKKLYDCNRECQKVHWKVKQIRITNMFALFQTI